MGDGDVFLFLFFIFYFLVSMQHAGASSTVYYAKFSFSRVETALPKRLLTASACLRLSMALGMAQPRRSMGRDLHGFLTRYQ